MGQKIKQKLIQFKQDYQDSGSYQIPQICHVWHQIAKLEPIWSRIKQFF